MEAVGFIGGAFTLAGLAAHVGDDVHVGGLRAQVARPGVLLRYVLERIE